MSEELQDEVEAINSIYGEGTLSPASEDSTSEYVLNLPGGASSLRLRFPASYPEAPPEQVDVPGARGAREVPGSGEAVRRAAAGVG
ncbi:hypothetical protein V2G26_003308 [Clonostachys chloroleuca]